MCHEENEMASRDSDRVLYFNWNDPCRIDLDEDLNDENASMGRVPSLGERNGLAM